MKTVIKLFCPVLALMLYILSAIPILLRLLISGTLDFIIGTLRGK